MRLVSNSNSTEWWYYRSYTPTSSHMQWMHVKISYCWLLHAFIACGNWLEYKNSNTMLIDQPRISLRKKYRMMQVGCMQDTALLSSSAKEHTLHTHYTNMHLWRPLPNNHDPYRMTVVGLYSYNLRYYWTFQYQVCTPIYVSFTNDFPIIMHQSSIMRNDSHNQLY